MTNILNKHTINAGQLHSRAVDFVEVCNRR